MVRAEQLQAIASNARDSPLALELPQDASGHLPAGSHQSGQVGSGEHGRLPKEQVPVPSQDPKHASPGVLVQKAVDALDRGVK